MAFFVSHVLTDSSGLAMVTRNQGYVLRTSLTLLAGFDC